MCGSMFWISTLPLTDSPVLSPMQLYDDDAVADMLAAGFLHSRQINLPRSPTLKTSRAGVVRARAILPIKNEAKRHLTDL